MPGEQGFSATFILFKFHRATSARSGKLLICYPIYLSIRKMEICKWSETGHTPWLAQIAFNKTRREKKHTPPDNSWNNPNLLSAIIIVAVCVSVPPAEPRCNRWLENSAALQSGHRAHCPPKAIQSQRFTLFIWHWTCSARWSLDMFRNTSLKHNSMYVYIYIYKFMVHFTAK